MAEKRGPKSKIVIDEEFLKRMEDYGRVDAKAEDIYLFYGISRASWYEKLKAHPEIREAIYRGRISGTQEIVGILYDKARTGNIQACRAYLQSQLQKLDGSYANCGLRNSEPKEVATKLNTTDPVEAARIYRQIILGEEV